jgi:tubulin polyglutamylase TTLL6/13
MEQPLAQNFESVNPQGEMDQAAMTPSLPVDDQIPNSSDQTALESDPKKTDTKNTKKKAKAKVVFNITDTRYEVVRHVARKMLNYKLTSEPEVEWDVFWTDNAVQPEFLARMQPFQKINHFPGMYSLARKNHLGRHLMRMKKAFPKNYKFFPQTYLLPAEYSEFKHQFSSGGPKVFIVKPEASCQGRGIFLTKTWENVQPGEHYVVQRYLQKPFLLDGLKFDLRLYVLLAGCDPLRIYLYDDGLGRFATEEYVTPTGNNIDNMCIHLTNYAINKDNPNFVFNKSAEEDNVGHKRSLKAVMKTLEERGHDVKALWNDIKKIIIKTFCSVQPILAHNYKSCQPDEPANNMCFEILGLDIILDHKLKPWLLEVNHTPSFTADTPLDKVMKRGVIRDALQLMNISSNHRIKYKNQKKVELQQRVLTGKKTRTTLEERQALSEKAQKDRDVWEANNCGSYEKIYPFDDPSKEEEDYTEFMRVAHKWWEEWTGTATKKRPEKPANDGNKLPPMSFGNSQNARAKEIQNVYTQKDTQKAKVNPNPNQKSAPILKTKPIDDTVKSKELVQDQEYNSLRCKVVGEDERDNFGDMNPIMEQASASEISLMGEDEAPPAKEPENHDENILEKELQTETTFDGTPVEGSKVASFRIRKPGVSSLVNDITKKILLSDKENSQTSVSKRSETLATIQKLTGVRSTSGSSPLMRTMNNHIDAYDLPIQKNLAATNSTFKLAQTISDEGFGTNDQVTSRTLDRQVKSSTQLENVRGFRLNQRKMVSSIPTSQKASASNGNGNRNFVQPKVFEMNFHASRDPLQKRLTVGSLLNPGLKTSNRVLGKPVISQSESHFQPNLLSNIQEAQTNLTRFYNVQVPK